MVKKLSFNFIWREHLYYEQLTHLLRCVILDPLKYCRHGHSSNQNVFKFVWFSNGNTYHFLSGNRLKWKELSSRQTWKLCITATLISTIARSFQREALLLVSRPIRCATGFGREQEKTKSRLENSLMCVKNRIETELLVGKFNLYHRCYMYEIFGVSL